MTNYVLLNLSNNLPNYLTDCIILLFYGND